MTHHESRKHPVHHTVPAILILLSIAIGVFVITLFSNQEHAQPAGVVVCTAAGCTKSVHDHVNIAIMACGERMHLPEETGTLDGPHTHSGDTVHLHTGIPYDADTGNFKDTSLRSLGRLFDVMQIPLTQNCIGSWCNGMNCNGHPGVLSMTVNGQPNDEFRSYRWSDKDNVVIRFQ